MKCILPWEPLFLAFVWMCVGFPLSVYAGNPQWIFSGEKVPASIQLVQGVCYDELGLQSFVPLGSDLSISFHLEDDQKFQADAFPFYALRYRITSGITQGGLFFTTDKLKELSDRSYSSFPIVGDGQWHNLVIDMRSCSHKQWTSQVTFFRLDPINPSDIQSKIYISRTGFFASEKEANDFLNAANDKQNFNQKTVFIDQEQRCMIPANRLKEGYQSKDWLISDRGNDELQKRIHKNSWSGIVVRTEGGTREILPISDTNSSGFTVFTANRPGPFSLACNDKYDTVSDLKNTKQDRSAKFVLARELMTLDKDGLFGSDRPGDPQNAAAVLALLGKYDLTSPKLAALARPEAQFTRGQLAQTIADSIQILLGTKAVDGYPPEYFSRERIRIGAWANFHTKNFDESRFRDLVDTGFDLIIDTSGKSASVDSGLFDWCDRYGIELFVHDGKFRFDNKLVADYSDRPCYSGHYITDEPGSDSYDKLAAVANDYLDKTGGKCPYINLLPMYANAAQLKYGAAAAAIEYYDVDPNLYKKYCDAFCEKFKAGFISTDIYPLDWVQGKKKTYKDYVESINLIASSARRHQKEFWCCIQVFSWTGSKRIPNESEYRWQCWSMLSFGCRGILAWTYRGYPEFPSLVDENGDITNMWYDARNVFREIRLLSDTYIQYDHVGAFTHNYTKETPWLRMSDPMPGFDPLAELQCPDPLLIGCFTAKKNAKIQGKAVTFVNMTDFESPQGTTVRFKSPSQKVTTWYRGLPQQEKPDASGFYTVRLASGEGVFVTFE